MPYSCGGRTTERGPNRRRPGEPALMSASDRAYRTPALATPGNDVLVSTLWGLGVSFLLIAGIFLGSRRFRDFDPALVSYAGALVFAAFGIAYRYAMWLRRPPTRLY